MLQINIPRRFDVGGYLSWIAFWRVCRFRGGVVVEVARLSTWFLPKDDVEQLGDIDDVDSTVLVDIRHRDVVVRPLSEDDVHQHGDIRDVDVSVLVDISPLCRCLCRSAEEAEQGEDAEGFDDMSHIYCHFITTLRPLWM